MMFTGFAPPSGTENYRLQVNCVKRNYLTGKREVLPTVMCLVVEYYGTSIIELHKKNYSPKCVANFVNVLPLFC